jgi:lipoate-protein ligase A
VQWLDRSFPNPAENLACDEVLLDLCEADAAHEVLRFWESATHFVVAGYSNKVETEINVEGCRRDRIPILRRCTGGGAVLQGPGCLNYALILSIATRPELQNITSANCHVMKRNCAAVSKLLGKRCSVEGYTDLALDGRKFSGNSQRRKRTHLLFHGTFLLKNFDLTLIERYLLLPSRRPEYRKSRSHSEFLRQIDIPATELKCALGEEWKIAEKALMMPDEPMVRLVAARYGREEWNLKF